MDVIVLMDYFNESVWLNILQGKGKSVDRMPPEKRERKLIWSITTLSIRL